MRSEYHHFSLTKHFEEFLSKGSDPSQRKIEQIEFFIMAYGKNGIRHIKLASLVGLSRRRLQHYIQILIKNGRIKRDGLKGPYFPAHDFYRDPIIDAKLFGSNFESLFLSRSGQIAFNQSLQYPIFSTNPNTLTQHHFENFASTKKYFDIKFSLNDMLEYQIFEFSNRLGAAIIYSIIQGLNSDNFPKSPSVILTPSFQNQLSMRYIDEAITHIIQILPQRFRQFFQYSLKTEFPGNGKPPDEVQIRYDPVIPYDKETIRLLLKAFSRVYPLLTFEFEKLRGRPFIYKKYVGNTSIHIEQHKKKIDQLHKNLEKQKKCRHEFKKPVRIFYRYAKQCKLCGYIQRVKKPL
jgi:hypothetical protein